MSTEPFRALGVGYGHSMCLGLGVGILPPMYFIPLLNEMTCSSFVSFKKKNDYCIYGCYFHINFVLCGHAHVVLVAPHKYFFNSMAHYVCLLFLQ